MKYFLHDTNAFQDEKVTELFMAHGYEGLGLFYSILEKLAQQEKPVKTAVLKQQLSVGKKLEKCWSFLESLQLISSNNGDTFNDNLLKFSEKYQVSKEKNREKVSQWREKQALKESVTGYVPVRNAPKDKISKDKISKETTSNEVGAATAAASQPEKKIELAPLQPESQPADALHTRGAANVPTRISQRAARPVLVGPLADLVNAGGLAESVQGMKKPFTQDEADTLLDAYGEDAARGIVQEMANYAKLGNNVSAYLTARKWMDKRIADAFKNSQSHDHSAHHRPQNGAAGYGQRSAPAVHANPFGLASPQSIAIARAVVMGGTDPNFGLDL